MKFVFFIRNTKICSINNAYATNDYQKSVDTQNWLYGLRIQMNQRKDQINKIKETFNREKHFLTVEYAWFLPQKEFYTTKGSINQRSGDWSNFPKIPDDEVFNRVLGIDDGAICKGTVIKLPWEGKSHHIRITIDILELKYLEQKSNLELPEFLRA